MNIWQDLRDRWEETQGYCAYSIIVIRFYLVKLYRSFAKYILFRLFSHKERDEMCETRFNNSSLRFFDRFAKAVGLPIIYYQRIKSTKHTNLPRIPTRHSSTSANKIQEGSSPKVDPRSSARLIFCICSGAWLRWVFIYLCFAKLAINWTTF